MSCSGSTAGIRLPMAIYRCVPRDPELASQKMILEMSHSRGTALENRENGKIICECLAYLLEFIPSGSIVVSLGRVCLTCPLQTSPSPER